MKLQYYETMDDKSNEYLLYLIEYIVPQFTESELKLFLEDITLKQVKENKSSKSLKSYVKLGDDGKSANLSKLNLDQLKTLFQVFVSRERYDRFAVKWRFYQQLKYMSDLEIKSVKINRDPSLDQYIDFIAETKKNKVILIFCYDILDLNTYNKGLEEINEFVKNENLIPDRIIFATNKSFRNLPLDVPIKLVNKELLPELLIEIVEKNLAFNKEDLLIVNDSELKVAGFNFVSTEDLLNYVYKYTKGGQISIYRQIDFFTEVSDDDPEVETIWKGIMLK